jgi:hypothetical protein
MSDIDQIDSIKDSVEELEKKQECILSRLDSTDATLRKILKSLDER